MAYTPVFTRNREIGAPTKLGWKVLDLTGQKFNSVDDFSDILAKFKCDSIKIVQISSCQGLQNQPKALINALSTLHNLQYLFLESSLRQF